MKKIDIYILKKLFLTFFFSLVGIMVIIVVFDVAERTDNFIKKNVAFPDILFYYYNFIKSFGIQLVPIFFFISTLITTTFLAQRTEIISLLSSGISYYRIIIIYIFSASLVAIFSIYFSFEKLPKANENLVEFECKYLSNCQLSSYVDIHLQIDKNEFIYFERFNFKENAGYYFTLEKFDQNELIYKLYAKDVELDTTNSKWIFYNYFIRELKDEHMNFVRGEKMDTTLNLSIRDLKTATKNDVREMTFSELNYNIKNSELRGKGGVEYLYMEKYFRILNPIIIIILSIIGFGLTSHKRKESMGRSIGLGMLIAFSSVFFFKLATAIGTSSILSPLITLSGLLLFYLILAVIAIVKTPK